MLYHVTFTTDHQALGFGEERARVSEAERARAVGAFDEGRIFGFWVRADLGGVIFVVDSPSHGELMAELQSLPLFPYLRSIDVKPVVSHSLLPSFGPAPTGAAK